MKYEMITETMKEIKKKSQKLWHQRNKNAFFFFFGEGFYMGSIPLLNMRADVE